MSYKKEVHDFAIKWIHKFKDPKICCSELVDHYMADDCNSLNFLMDCGNSFECIYGKAVYDSSELNQVVGDITDIALLGSAIYSRWRYFNHWAYDESEILESENREWFTLALARLESLTC